MLGAPTTLTFSRPAGSLRAEGDFDRHLAGLVEPNVAEVPARRHLVLAQKARDPQRPSWSVPIVVGGSHHSPLTSECSAWYAGFGEPSARMKPPGAPSQPPSASPQ
jgi:hypothetical protein